MEYSKRISGIVLLIPIADLFEISFSELLQGE